MKGARTLGLYWAAVAAALVAASPAAPGVLVHLPACLLKQTLGVPCPTCGGTRAALALGQLDLAEAFRLNPLVTLGLAAFVGGGLLAGVLAALDRPLQEPTRYPGWARALAVLALAANWVWLVADGR